VKGNVTFHSKIFGKALQKSDFAQLRQSKILKQRAEPFISETAISSIANRHEFSFGNAFVRIFSLFWSLRIANVGSENEKASRATKKGSIDFQSAQLADDYR